MADRPYDPRSSCASLLGYGANAHRRSGGVCTYCGFGRGHVDFDLWRQLTVDHVIPRSCGGARDQILPALQDRFRDLRPRERSALARRVEDLNLRTACANCNHLGNQLRTGTNLADLIGSTAGTVDDVLSAVATAVEAELPWRAEQARIRRDALRETFERETKPILKRVRVEREEPKT